jgi:hypothetical protein
MIKYALRCDGAHNWDAWFPSISGYDDQQTRGLVDCPFCGSKAVEKAPMAPSIRTSKSVSPELETKSEAASTKPDQADTQLPVMSQNIGLTIPEPIKAMMAEIKAHVEATHDYVGDTFAREVRAMHEGETEERPIYGEATPSEVRALIEDEIPVAPLPMLASPKGAKGVH